MWGNPPPPSRDLCSMQNNPGPTGTCKRRNLLTPPHPKVMDTSVTIIPLISNLSVYYRSPHWPPGVHKTCTQLTVEKCTLLFTLIFFAKFEASYPHILLQSEQNFHIYCAALVTFSSCVLATVWYRSSRRSSSCPADPSSMSRSSRPLYSQSCHNPSGIMGFSISKWTSPTSALSPSYCS